MLEREQFAVGLAAFGDPLVGQLHRLGPVRRGRAEFRLGVTVEVGVEPDQRLDQFVRRPAGIVLELAVDPPPVDLELGRLGRVGGLPVGEADQAVEAAHAGPGALGVVVGVGRPQLVGAQDQPGAVHGAEPVHAEAHPDQAERGPQDLRPVAQVVAGPGAVLQVGEPDGIEGPEPRRRASADLASAHELPLPLAPARPSSYWYQLARASRSQRRSSAKSVSTTDWSCWRNRPVASLTAKPRTAVLIRRSARATSASGTPPSRSAAWTASRAMRAAGVTAGRVSSSGKAVGWRRAVSLIPAASAVRRSSQGRSGGGSGHSPSRTSTSPSSRAFLSSTYRYSAI